MAPTLLPGPVPLSGQVAENGLPEVSAGADKDASYSAQLLFVNKDARSLFEPKSKPKSKEIFSHVQRVAAHSVRRQRIARIKPLFPATQTIADPSIVAQRAQEGVDQKKDGEGDQVVIKQIPLYSANVNRGDGFDPFDSTCIRVNSEVLKIITYFMSVCIPAIFKFDVDVRPAHKHHFANHFDEVVRRCLHNEMHMYTILAVASGRLANVANKKNLVSPSLAQHFMCKAVECLRKYFASDGNLLTDKHVIFTLVCVSSFEWYLGDYEASRIHLRAIGYPFALLDESCEYDRWAMAMASHPDLYMAIETLSPPVLPAKKPRSYPKAIPISPLGRNFKDLLDLSYFGVAMAPIVTDLLSCMQVWKKLTRSASLSDTIWTGQQIHFVLHRLLSIGLETGLNNEEECCRIALILVLTYLVTLTCKRSGVLNANRLQMALSRVEPRPRAFKEQELLFWITITGVFAAGESEVADPLAAEAVQLAIDLKINTYTKLLRLMERFIWIEKLQEPCLHQLWTKIAVANDPCGQDYGSPTEVIEHLYRPEIATVRTKISEIVTQEYMKSLQAKK